MSRQKRQHGTRVWATVLAVAQVEVWRRSLALLLFLACVLHVAPVCAQMSVTPPAHGAMQAVSGMAANGGIACGDPCCAGKQPKQAPVSKNICVEHCVASAMPAAVSVPVASRDIPAAAPLHDDVPPVLSVVVEQRLSGPPPLLAHAFFQPLRI